MELRMKQSFKHYSASVKAAAVKRYLTTESTYRKVASEMGVSAWSVRQWVNVAREAGDGAWENDLERRPDERSGEEKVQLLLEVQALREGERGAFLREHGVRDGDLERWRNDAARGLERVKKSRNEARRIKELEAINRKQAKRLHEANALLELQKKVQELWEGEDDDITKQSET